MQVHRRTDRIADWLNLIFLATVALLPFFVSVLAEASRARASLQFPVGLYLADICVGGLALTAFFGYIARRDSAADTWLSDDGRRHVRPTIQRNLILPALSAIVFVGFTLAPDLVRDHLLSFMMLPPASYFLFTMVWARPGKRVK